MCNSATEKEKKAYLTFIFFISAMANSTTSMDVSAAAGSVGRGITNAQLRNFGARLGQLDRARGGTSQGTSGHYGSGARLRSRDRDGPRTKSEGPAGPQTAQDWHDKLSNAKERIEAHERTIRNQTHSLAKLDAKVDELHARLSAQETRGDHLREQMTEDRQRVTNLGNNIEKDYATKAQGRI